MGAEGSISYVGVEASIHTKTTVEVEAETGNTTEWVIIKIGGPQFCMCQSPLKLTFYGNNKGKETLRELYQKLKEIFE